MNIPDFDSNSFKEKLVAYEEAVKTGKLCYFDLDNLLDIIFYYSQNDEPQKSKEAIDYALKIYPSNTDLLVCKARALMNQMNWEDAIVVAEKIEDQDDQEAVFLKAELLIYQDKIKEADTLLKDYIINQNNNDVGLLTDVISLFTDSESYKIASRWIDYSLQFYPEDKQIMEAQADCFTQQRRYAKAIETYNKLLDINPYSIGYWNELARIYLQQNNMQKTIEAYEFSLAIDSDQYIPLYDCAHCYLFIGEYSKAQNLFWKAHLKYPDQFGPLHYYAVCLSAQNKVLEAISFLKDSLDLAGEGKEGDNNRAESYGEFAILYSKLGNHKKSVDYYDLAISNNGKNLTFVIMKGFELTQLGHSRLALKCFREALEKDYDFAFSTILRTYLELNDDENWNKEAALKTLQSFLPKIKGGLKDLDIECYWMEHKLRALGITDEQLYKSPKQFFKLYKMLYNDGISYSEFKDLFTLLFHKKNT